jgi:hypothetical protein
VRIRRRNNNMRKYRGEGKNKEFQNGGTTAVGEEVGRF